MKQTAAWHTDYLAGLNNPVICIPTFITVTLLNLPNRNIVQNDPHSLYSALTGMYTIL